MPSSRTANRILSQLPAADRAAVIGAGAMISFQVGETLAPPDEPIHWVYFVESGVISAVAEMSDGRTIETFMVGCEGLSGAAAAQAPAITHSRHVCQVAGKARRLEAERLRGLVEARPVLRRAIADYAAALQAELEQSGACNALHSPSRRFAKWLLRCHDRVGGEVVQLTQEYLASMLGAQRTTVNEAAQALQRAGAIRYSRGRVQIVDRGALEAAACECYRGLNLPSLKSPG